MAGLISPAVLEQIRAANDIVDVIGASIPLKRNGANFVALCPFHREKTPSFNVSSQRQSFHCFGCHKGGDVFTWVREYENLGFMDAIKRLAERANIPLEFEQNPAFQQTRALKDSLLAIHEQIAQRWQRCLANEAGAEPARAYLTSRAVPADAIETFRLGYAPEAWDDTVNWARSKGHDTALMEQAGLIIKRDGADGHYDRFRGRLIFPICDEQGRVIGFSGRVLDPEAKTAKYVNSPETPIFTKGRVFFGLDKSKRALLDEQRAIVCEGQLDLIRCFMSGTRNIVAPQGTALTADHARILKRYVEEVILCFDADEAGRNAAERSFDSLMDAGLAVRVAQVPAPHDPDSFIREHGGEAFGKIIDAAVGYYDFLLDRFCKDYDPRSDRGRIAIVEQMLQALAKSRSESQVEFYLRKTAQRLEVAPDRLRKDFKGLVTAATRSKSGISLTDDRVSEETPEEPDPIEMWLLRLLLRHEDLVDWFRSYLDSQWLSNAISRELVEARLSMYGESAVAIISHLPHDSARALASKLLTEGMDMPEVSRQAEDVVTRLRNRFLDRELGRLTARTGTADMSHDEQVRLLRLAEELRRAKRQPLIPLPEA